MIMSVCCLQLFNGRRDFRSSLISKTLKDVVTLACKQIQCDDRIFTANLCGQSSCMTQLSEGRKERIFSFYKIQIEGFHGYSPVAERGFLLAVYKNGDSFGESGDK